MKKRKLSLKKLLRFIIIIVLLVTIGFLVYKYFFGQEAKPKVVKTEDEIPEYGYKMDDNETEYYKSLFKELKKVLEADEVDQDKYAKLLCQLFIADFMNLDNKTSKNDVGGVQFVYKDFQSDFIKIAKDSIYSNLMIKDSKSKKDEMPEVTKVSIEKLEHASHNYLDKTDADAIKVNLKIEYKTDLDYQETTTLTLVHSGKKLEIVEMSKE